MLVQWTTVERGRPAARWGLRPGEYTNVALASLDTYTRGDMCGGTAATLHIVVNPAVWAHEDTLAFACKPCTSTCAAVPSAISLDPTAHNIHKYAARP